MTKILIADDISTNRLLLRHTLSTIGDYEIVEAVDGQDAINVFENENPDLILMDIMMPGMDGREATTIIKSKNNIEYVPVIFLTALSSDDALSSALKSGGDDFVSKPFDIDILNSKIHAHLRIRELTQALNNKNKVLTNVNANLLYEQDLIEHFFKSAIDRSYLDKKIIKYHMSSMSAFNGDLFLSEVGPDGSLYVIVGDFTGHGLTASMGTLPVAMTFFNMVHSGLSVGEIAHEINYQLHNLMPHGMFFAATVLQINAYDGGVSIWAGGMPDMYIFDETNSIKNIVTSKHMPLGILDNDEFDSLTQIINISETDKIYLYSDGVVEARNPNNELFGDERLKQLLTDSGSDRFDLLLDKLKNFTGLENQKDDITFIEVKCKKLPIPTSLINKKINSTLDWNISITIHEREMKTSNPISKLFEILNSLPFVSEYKDTLHVMIFEIYNNALDHSILNLDSMDKSDPENFSQYYKTREQKISELENAFVEFKFNFIFDNEHRYIEITSTDSGEGYKKKETKSLSEDSHGRGLDIIKSLCEKVTFSEDGKTFTALYRL